LGDGKDIRFWKDKWLDNEVLRVKFSRLFSIANEKFASLSQVGFWNNDTWCWKVAWRRNLFEWEIGEENQLTLLLDNKTLLKESRDQWICKATKKLSYTVNLAYNCLRIRDEGANSTLYEALWSIKALPSTLTTAWRVLNDSLPMRANLERRGLILESNRCAMCGEDEESESHVFFECRVAWRVWCICSE